MSIRNFLSRELKILRTMPSIKEMIAQERKILDALLEPWEKRLIVIAMFFCAVFICLLAIYG